MTLRHFAVAAAAVLSALAARDTVADDASVRQPVARATPRSQSPVNVHRFPPIPQIVFEAPGIPGDGLIQQIFTIDLDGSHRRQITQNGFSKFLPHFSPDGTRLVYTVFFEGRYGDPNARTDVVVYDFASGQETRLTRTGWGFQPVWSPDGERIAFGSYNGDSLWIMDADGSNPRFVGAPSNGPADKRWNDFAWSSENWILFTVAQVVNGCFKVRIDKIRPDGTARTQVSDGGSNCTPPGMEQSGDADPGFSADGKIIYSSRGFPNSPAGLPHNAVRRLYALSSDPWVPGKTETDLSLTSAADCIEGVPKGSPDGRYVLLFRLCPGETRAGVTLTDTSGSYRRWITDGFGPDWNPAAFPAPLPAVDTAESTNRD